MFRDVELRTILLVRFVLWGIASFGDSTRPQHLETTIQNNTIKQFIDIHLVNMTIESMNPYMCTCFFKIIGLFKQSANTDY